MMKFLLLLLAGLAGWRWILRPWIFRNESTKVQEDPRFHGEQVRDADFEELEEKENGEKGS